MTFGQAPAANPAELARKFEAEFSALQKTKETVGGKIRDHYLEDLKSAEREAIAGGAAKTAERAAIQKEMQALRQSGGKGEATPGLPAALAKRREATLAAMATVDADYAERAQHLAAGYLTALQGIESTLPPDAPTRAGLDALKVRLAATAGVELPKPLDESTFANTEWLWMAREDKVWTFLPGGKIKPDPATHAHMAWKITGSDTFQIVANGKATWELKYHPDLKEGQGVNLNNPNDTKRLVFKRKVEP